MDIERIHGAYKKLLIDEENEIVSKTLVKQSTYLTRDEIHAICKQQVKKYIAKVLKQEEDHINEELDKS